MCLNKTVLTFALVVGLFPRLISCFQFFLKADILLFSENVLHLRLKSVFFVDIIPDNVVQGKQKKIGSLVLASRFRLGGKMNHLEQTQLLYFNTTEQYRNRHFLCDYYFIVIQNK